MSTNIFKPLHPLSNTEIEDVLRSRIPQFLGVFARNALPRHILQTGDCCVINLDDATGEGTHWTCIYCGDDYNEWFDSYGIIPPLNVRKWMKKNKKESVYSSNQIQPIGSVLCGYYVIWYLIMRTRGVSQYDLLYKFKNDNEKSNDKKLIKWLKKILIS